MFNTLYERLQQAMVKDLSIYLYGGKETVLAQAARQSVTKLNEQGE